MKVRQRRPTDTGSVVIRKRADGSDAYMLKWRAFTRTVPVTSKREALELLPAFVAEARSGEIERQRAAAKARDEQPTLTEWVEVFLAQHVSQDPDREATRSIYKSMLRLYVLPALGHYKLGEITAMKVRETMQDLYRAGRAIGTLRLTYAVLHRAFDSAIEDGRALSNPMPKFSKLRLGDGISAAETAKRSALNQGQVVALLAACVDPSLRLYVAIMAACGLRPGETVGLRWRDVSGDVLHVRGAAKTARPSPGIPKRVWIGATKTRGSVRDIAIGPALVALFDAERERQEAYQRALLGGGAKVRGIKLLPSDAVVFPSDPATADGLIIPIDPVLMRGRFKWAAARAGLATATPHWLRHTSISHSIEGGLSLADTAARAGHSSVMTTAKTYVHALNESQRKAALIGDSLLAKVEQPVNEKPENPGHK